MMAMNSVACVCFRATAVMNCVRYRYNLVTSFLDCQELFFTEWRKIRKPHGKTLQGISFMSSNEMPLVSRHAIHTRKNPAMHTPP